MRSWITCTRRAIAPWRFELARLPPATVWCLRLQLCVLAGCYLSDVVRSQPHHVLTVTGDGIMFVCPFGGLCPHKKDFSVIAKATAHMHLCRYVLLCI